VSMRMTRERGCHVGAVTKSLPSPVQIRTRPLNSTLRGAFVAWYSAMAANDTMGSVVMDDHPGVLHGLPVAVFRTASRPNRTFCSSTTHPPESAVTAGRLSGMPRAVV
jgi:hypothetical protein